MAEYIEREPLLKEMLGLHTIPVYIGHVTDEDVMFETMVDVVREQPIADVVEVKHGYWIKIDELAGIEFLKCSVCGKTHPRARTEYCCDCGAKMDLEGAVNESI